MKVVIAAVQELFTTGGAELLVQLVARQRLASSAAVLTHSRLGRRAAVVPVG